MFLFASSDANGTAPSVVLLLGIVPTELRGMLEAGWPDMLPLATPLASAAASVRAGDDLRPGKVAVSSSLPIFERFRGEEGIEAAAFSRIPRVESGAETDNEAEGEGDAADTTNG